MRSLFVSAAIFGMSLGLAQAAEPLDGSTGSGCGSCLTVYTDNQPLLTGRSTGRAGRGEIKEAVRLQGHEHVNPLSGRVVGQPLQPNDLGYGARR